MVSWRVILLCGVIYNDYRLLKVPRLDSAAAKARFPPDHQTVLLLLLQVKYAEDQDFFYAQYTSLYSNLVNLGYKNNEIVTVTGTTPTQQATRETLLQLQLP
jgi:hypothetical protein